MFCSQAIDSLHKQGAHSRSVFHQILLIDDLQRSQSACHRQIVASERARMHYATIHARKCFLINVPTRDDRAARHETTTETFCDRDNVRLQIPMLETEHPPSASEPGLHFIGNQQRSVFPAKFLGTNKKIGPWCLTTFALNGLNDKCGDIERA